MRKSSVAAAVRRRLKMSTRRASITITVILTLMLLSISVSGQSPTTQAGSSDKPIVAAQGPRPVNQENKVVDDPPKPKDLESQVAAVKAENEAFRESLRKMEEQQKVLLEMMDRLQRKLDGAAIVDVSGTAQSREVTEASAQPAAAPEA